MLFMEVIEPILLDFGTFDFWRGVDSRHSWVEFPKTQDRKNEKMKSKMMNDEKSRGCNHRAVLLSLKYYVVCI